MKQGRGVQSAIYSNVLPSWLAQITPSYRPTYREMANGKELSSGDALSVLDLRIGCSFL